MSDTFIQGRQYLHILLQQLSRMRGKESRYLRPLMGKVHDVLGYELSQSLPLPTSNVLDFNQRGAVGKVYDEEETRTMGMWLQQEST